MALSGNRLLQFVTPTDHTVYPVAAAAVIYDNAFIGEDTLGNARPLVAADPFLGIAMSPVDNTTGAAGDLTVEVKHKGFIIHAVTGVSDKTANDRPAVYASDDGTLTLTATGNTLVGRVLRWVSGSTCVVEFNS